MKKYFILLLLCGYIGVIIGQVDSLKFAIADTSYVTRANLKNDLSEINNKLELNNTNDYKLGSISIKDSVQYSGRSLKIDKVIFNLKEGMLDYVAVELEGGLKFYNKKAPIAIIYGNRYLDKLYIEGKNKDSVDYVDFGDIVTIAIDKRFRFIPNDEDFILLNNGNPKDAIKILTKNGNLGSLVNVVVFTDLLGLLGDFPNALVHFEANAQFYLHRKNIRNSFFYLAPTIKPSFHFNRLDNKFDTLFISDNNINPIEIFRRHSYAVGIVSSILKHAFKPSNSWEINLGYQYLATNLMIIDEFDENIKSSVKSAIHNIYGDFVFKSKVLQNFGIDLLARYMRLSLNRSQYYHHETSYVLGFRGSIFYFTPTSKGNDKIFLRFTNYLVNNNRSLDFAQIQFGISKSLMKNY